MKRRILSNLKAGALGKTYQSGNLSKVYKPSVSTLDPLTLNYNGKVIVNGGTMVDLLSVNDAIRHARANGYLDKLKTWLSPTFGVNRDVIGGPITGVTMGISLVDGAAFITNCSTNLTPTWVSMSR